MRLVALDFETTGSVKGWPNEPWQLGMIDIVDGAPRPETRWETWLRVAPERPFAPRAPGRWAEVRGELATAPTLQECWEEIVARLGGAPLVAHNAATERTMLVKAAPLAQFGPWIDTLRMARRLWPRLDSYALGDLVETLGLAGRVAAIAPPRSWHDALYDACAGAVLYAHLIETAGSDLTDWR